MNNLIHKGMIKGFLATFNLTQKGVKKTILLSLGFGANKLIF